ncbi:MAG: class I SAM-dependent methyltransferase [Solirubrobacterales bacterium]|nr:class I SAM-dependent methyltransferase [Solirubrobacterales bacterium]
MSSRENLSRASVRARQAVRELKARLFPGDPYADLDAGFAAVRGRMADFTMTSVERQYALWKAVGHIESAGISGDVVECGVWRGGSSMLVALTLADLGAAPRDLWLFDTFSGMSPPGEFDLDPAGRPMTEQWHRHEGRVHDPVFAYCSLDEVRRNMASTGYPEQNIRLVPGPVEKTIPDQAPDRIALLRLDTDWYRSTRHELEQLWPRLSPGGVLVIDDYGHWAGARKAVDEYFAGRSDAPLLNRVDYSGRIAVKA